MEQRRLRTNVARQFHARHRNIGIPDTVLFKPGKFEPHEWAIMKNHAAIGAYILEDGDSDLLRMAHAIALNHHEKWDGGGYPRRLAGEAIPLAARIVAVADVFDALTSPRLYRPAWPVERAVAYLRNNAGTHFDPAVIGLFMAHLEKAIALWARHREPGYVHRVPTKRPR